MDHLSKYTLKGYFEQLKSAVDEQSGSGKASVKASALHKSTDDATNKVLELLIKAVALVEEIYLYDSDFLHEDHLNDYREMITTLNARGIAYKGNQEILNLDGKPILDFVVKKPMQKATNKNRADKSTKPKRKAG